MNQQINLYLAEFRQQKDFFDTNNIGRLILLLVFFLSAISGLEYWHSSSLNSTLVERQGEYAQLLSKANKLADNLLARNSNNDLLEAEIKLEESLRSKRQILKLLGDDGQGNTFGFSHYLTDLSNYHIAGLRLTKINLSNGGKDIFLRGEVQQADKLPQFLLNLNHSEVFQGVNFGSLQIEESEDLENETKHLFFNLATKSVTERVVPI